MHSDFSLNHVLVRPFFYFLLTLRMDLYLFDLVFYISTDSRHQRLPTMFSILYDLRLELRSFLFVFFGCSVFAT